MKKIKVILSVLLSIMMLIGCMPLAGFVSAEESEDTVYTIFAAAPEKYDVGTDVTVAKLDSGASSKQTVTTSAEEGYAYYTFTQNYKQNGSLYGGASFAKSGETNNSKGTNVNGTEWSLAWIGNANVVNALSNSGLVQTSVDYKITRTGTQTSSIDLFVFGFNTYESPTNDNLWLRTNVTEFDQWKTATYTAKLINFYSGILSFKAELGYNNTGAALEDVTVVTNLRNIKLTVKESDREAINTALAETDYDFDDLIAPYLGKEDVFVPDDPGTDHIIYKSNPFKAGIVGADVSVEDSNGNSGRGAVEVKADDEGAYFSYTDEYATTGQSQWNRRYHYFMGYNDKNAGLGWMATTNVTDKIIGKITASIKVRINATATSGSAPTEFPLYFGIFNSGTTSSTAGGQTILNTKVKETGKWIEITNIPVKALPSFYSGYACVRIEPDLFDGTVTVDMKDFKLTINSNDKDDIDTALADTDYDFDSLIATFADGGLINPDETSADTDVLWYANPDRVTSENGGDVTADKYSDSGLPYKTEYRTVRVYDDEGVYYRIAMNVSGSGGNGQSSMFKSDFSHSLTEGYGWLNNADVMAAIAPYVNLSFLYRFEGTVPTGGGTPTIYINGVNGYDKIWNTNVPITNSGRWTEASMKAINYVGGDYGWYDAYVAVNIYVWNSSFSGAQKIDIKDMRWELKLSDRVNINKALSEIDGIDNIPNFTEGVEIATDINGYKDYYSLLVNPVKTAPKYDVDDDGVATVKDLVRMKKHVAWEFTLNDMMIERADADANGEVDSTDIAECRKVLIGK